MSSGAHPGVECHDQSRSRRALPRYFSFSSYVVFDWRKCCDPISHVSPCFAWCSPLPRLRFGLNEKPRDVLRTRLQILCSRPCYSGVQNPPLGSPLHFPVGHRATYVMMQRLPNLSQWMK